MSEQNGLISGESFPKISYCCCMKYNYLSFLLLHLWALKFPALTPCHGRALVHRRVLPGERNYNKDIFWKEKEIFFIKDLLLLSCLAGSELLCPCRVMPAPASPSCVCLGWDGARECFLWKAKDLCFVCVCVCQLLLSLCPSLLMVPPHPQGCSTLGFLSSSGIFH